MRPCTLGAAPGDRLRGLLCWHHDRVINLMWGWGQKQDLLYLSVPDGYGCQQTRGHRRASPRRQERPPATAMLTSPTASSCKRGRGGGGIREGE